MAVWSSGLRKLLVSKWASRSQRQRAISNVDLTKALSSVCVSRTPPSPIILEGGIIDSKRALLFVLASNSTKS